MKKKWWKYKSWYWNLVGFITLIIIIFIVPVFWLRPGLAWARLVTKINQQKKRWGCET